jgi:hypothetical protein
LRNFPLFSRESLQSEEVCGQDVRAHSARKMRAVPGAESENLRI